MSWFFVRYFKATDSSVGSTLIKRLERHKWSSINLTYGVELALFNIAVHLQDLIVRVCSFLSFILLIRRWVPNFSIKTLDHLRRWVIGSSGVFRTVNKRRNIISRGRVMNKVGVHRLLSIGLVLVSSTRTLYVRSIYRSWHPWWLSLFGKLILSVTSSSRRLGSMHLGLNHNLWARIFESLIHSNFSGSWSLLLSSHICYLKVAVHRATSWFELLETISLLLRYFHIHMLFLAKILFTGISCACRRFIHSCPQTFMRNLIFCGRGRDVLTTSIVQLLVHLVRTTNWVAIRSLPKLWLWRNYSKLIDRIWISLVDV